MRHGGKAVERRAGRDVQRGGRAERVANAAILLRVAAAELALREEDRRRVRHADRRHIVRDAIPRRQRLSDTVVRRAVFGRVRGGHRTVQTRRHAQKRTYVTVFTRFTSVMDRRNVSVGRRLFFFIPRRDWFYRETINPFIEKKKKKIIPNITFEHDRNKNWQIIVHGLLFFIIKYAHKS